MALSPIEWTEATWNPVTGCSKLSPGCEHCYAATLAKRLRLMGQKKYADGFEVRIHPDTLELPRRWRKPRFIFVNSMSDLFHPLVPDNFIASVFAVMNETPRHRFQVLTKRPERMSALASTLNWTPNIWAGATVELNDYLARLESLRKVPARVRFVSLEPLLGALPDFTPTGLQWVIVGGESGPKARPMEAEWVRDIRDKCQNEGVPFFFKQWGGFHRRERGRELDGRLWDEKPQDA